MTRLVFVSTLAYNYFFPGKIKQAGGHTRIYNLSRAFAKKPGYKVFCITGDFGQPDIIEKHGVTLVKAPIDNPLAFLKVLKIIKNLKPDILVDLCASPRLFLYSVLKRFIDFNYVFLTCCDNDVNGNYKKVENIFFHCLYISGLKNADRIVAQVPEHQMLLKQNYNQDSDLVLSPYFDIKEKQTTKNKIILWVGRAAYYKRPDIFINLAEKFTDQHFVMICNQSSYDNGFMRKIKKGNIPANLKFYEYVPYPEMQRFYEKAMFIVNTSDYEGFPNTFIEAAINNTPILSLNSDPNGMLSAHGAGFACNGKIEQLNKKCNKMVQDMDLLQTLGQKAFDYAFKFHRIEMAVDKFDKIFQSIKQDLSV